MMKKEASTLHEAVAGIADGATLTIGGLLKTPLKWKRPQ